MTYVKINNTLYPAQISGKLRDYEWNDRASKTITLEMEYATAIALFVDDLEWSIYDDGIYDNVTSESEEFDNSEYCIAGDVTDHRDGTVSVKMGMPTDGEILAIITGGAI